ncbi:MAG: RNA polymerase sigma factor [Deltaproteobacteria bacterium]|nr:MAG: RNA polymerase sigma factor [Deltaproteobacteria bacterium]
MPTASTVQSALIAQAPSNPVESPSPAWTLDRERRLADRLKRGDAAAFRELYEHFAPIVLRSVLMPMVRNPQVAEDLLAETFTRVFEHRARFSWHARGMFPWIARIARNLAVDHLRKDRRRRALPEDFDRYLPDPAEWTADRLLVRDEFADLVRVRIERVLGELHPRYRRVIELRILEGRSRAEAAEVLGVSVPTLDVVLSRACKSFRTKYRDLFVPEGGSPWEEGEP